MLTWYQQDVYLQSIVAASGLAAEELAIMQKSPMAWSKQQINLYSFVLLYAAVIRYQKIGLSLPTQVSGIGSHVLHAALDKTRVDKTLVKLRSGTLVVDDIPPLESSIGNGYISFLEACAAHYQQGKTVNWLDFWKGHVCQKIVLPLYPFQRQRYWYDSVLTCHARKETSALRGSAQLTHLAGGELVYEHRIDLKEEASRYLTGHQVSEQIVFPAAAYIDLILRAAAALKQKQLVTIPSIQFQHPLLLSEGKTTVCQVRLKPLTDTKQGYAVEIYAWQEQEIIEVATCYVKAAIEFASVSAQTTLDVSMLQLRSVRSPSGDIYVRLNNMGLSYSLDWQLVQSSIILHEDQLIVSIAAKAGQEEGASVVTALDAALHSTILLIDEKDLPRNTLLVPKALEGLVVSGDLSQTAFAVATKQTSASGTSLSFTIDVFDQYGNRLARFERYLVAKIKANQLAKDGLPNSCFQVVWQQSTLTSSLNPASHFSKIPDYTRFAVALPSESELPRKNSGWLDQYGLLVIKMILVKRWPSLQTTGKIIDTNRPEVGKQPEGHFAKLIQKCFYYLTQAGVIHPLDQGNAKVVNPLSNLSELQKELTKMPIDENDIQAVFLQSVTREIEKVIDGEMDPLKALFPEDAPAESFRHAAAVYQHAKDAHFANLVTTRMLEALKAFSGDAPIRILEIGAGTGGTTRSVIVALKQFAQVRYVYTDLSPAFARHCDECFVNTAIEHQFAVLDISRNPAEQGFADGQFDIIIATNVLHATPHLQQTLVHVQKLLVKGGVSLISETIEDAVWLDLTFGLTPGWWAFNDGIRIRSPLLTQKEWESALHDAGMPCQYSQGASQRVFLACSPQGPKPLMVPKVQAMKQIVLAFDSIAASRMIDHLKQQGVISIALSLAQTSEMTQALSLLQESINPTVYFLADPLQKTDASMASYQARVGQPFLQLLQALHGKKATINLVTYQSRAAANEAIQHPEQVTLSGLLTSAAAENRQWKFKTVDCESYGAEDTNLVVRLSLQTTSDAEFILRDKHILVPRLEEKAELMNPQQATLADVSGVVLITGGTGEIGQALVERLANQGHKQFALLNRRTSASHSLSTRSDLSIEIYEEDLSDLKHLSQTWQLIVQKQGNITKVYHLAGTLDDHALVDMTWDAVSNVFKSKVVGAYHLHLVTLTNPVNQFVLFSSVAALLSTPGQMNHVAANRYLDSLAQMRRTQGFPAVSINWGFWSQIGSAARIKADELGKRKGFLSLTPEQCFIALQQIEQVNPTQAVVARFDWFTFFSQFSMQSVPPLFASMVSSYSAVLIKPKQTSTTVFDWHKFVQQYPQTVDQQAAFAKVVLVLLCQSLQVKDHSHITTDAPLNAFPVEIDSLAKKEIVESLNEQFGWQGAEALSTSIFFSHESINEIAKTIWHQLTSSKVEEVEKTKRPSRKKSTAVKDTTSDSALAGYQEDAVAIIGMSLRFPGANNPREYWRQLNSQDDPIAVTRPNRSGEKCYFGITKGEKAKRAQAALLSTDISQFDAGFFNISDEEAMVMDPQQRMLLELVWEALEQAGIAPSSLKGSKTSVVVGIAANEFGDLLLSHSADDQFSRYHASGNNPSATVGRISFQLGLQGPNLAVNTACSSSLTALDTACRHIKDGVANMAITGAVNLILSPGQMKLYQSNGMLSPTRHCHTFSDQADGMVRAEGCAVYVLKSLTRALQDGDNILAVVEGTAMNQNGASFSFMAPDMNAQRALIKESLTAAGIQAEQLDWVETHGTGTKLGDPVEVEALARELAVSRRKLPLGAVKANLGHAEAAAGAAGLSKIVLALQNGSIPPNRFAGQLNPLLQRFTDQVEPVVRTKLWVNNPERTRRALLSSFGFSGTNAQAIITEAPTAMMEPSARLALEWQRLQADDTSWLPVTYQPETTPSGDERLIVVSAKSEAALREQLTHLKAWFEAYPNPYEPELLERVAMTLSKGRDHFNYRVAMRASTVDDLQETISKKLEKTMFTAHAQRPNNMAFLFTGQGSQYERMAHKLYLSHPLFRSIFDHCNQLLKQYLDIELSEIMFADKAKDYLSKTTYAQPALFVLEYSLARVLIAYGIQPSYVLGHSVGEYVAATLAGCMSLNDALKLICARGEIMEKAPEGKMLILGTDVKTAQDILDESKIAMDIAGMNHPSQTVLSGSIDAADKATELFKSREIRVTALPVSKAFHSRCMDPVLAEFRIIADQLTYHDPEHYVFISSLTGQQISTKLNAEHWVDHLRRGVDFVGAVTTLSAMGVAQCCELGPKTVLVNLAKSTLGDKAQQIVWYETLSDRKSDVQQLYAMVSRFYELGGQINWQAFWIGTTVAPIDLPKYAFQRQSYWPEVLGGPQRQLLVQKQAVVVEDKKVEQCSPAQEVVVSCLKQALPGKEVTSLDKSLIDYGGSSLELPVLQELLYQTTGVSFSMKELEMNTLRQLAQRLPEQFKAMEAPQAPSDKASWYKPFPLNPIQYAYWIGRQGIIPLGNVSAHGYLEVKMANIDVARLQNALNQLIKRHHMLRITVNRQGTQCVQKTVPEYQIPIANLSRQTEAARQQQLLAVRDELSHQVKDASVWPLFDIRVTQVAAEHYILHLSFDSLIIDMYSMRMLFDEWYQLYISSSYQLMPLIFTFRDYHFAVEALKEQEHHQKAKTYWLDRVKTMPLGPELPLLMDPAQVKEQSFVRCNAVVPQEKWFVIKEKAKQMNVTPTTVLLTLFSVVLGRYSHKKEFLVNLTLFRRNNVHPEVKQLLGDFTNIEVFATNVSQCHTMSFAHMVESSKDRLLADLDHADFNGVDVQRALAAHHKLEGGQSVAPIVFTSLLNLKLGRDFDRQAGDSVWQQFGEVVFSITQTPQIWLDHKTFESSEGLVVEWDYVKALFGAQMIAQMHADYMSYIDHLSQANWQSPLPDLVTPRLIADMTRVNQTAVAAYVRPETLVSLMAKQVLNTPDLRAVFDAEDVLSYGEFDRQTTKVAAALQEQGVRKGNFVGVCIHRSVDLLVAIVAILKAGGVYLPIESGLPLKRKEYVLQDSKAPVVLTDNPDLELKTESKIMIINEAKRTSASFIPVVINSDDLAYLLYTSGSSGKPKGVMIEHLAVVNRLLWMQKDYQVSSVDVFIQKTPVSFDVSIWELFLPLIIGASVFMPKTDGHKDVAYLQKTMHQHGVTRAHFVPSMLEIFLQGTKHCSLPQLKTVFCSGEALLAIHVNQFNQQFAQTELVNFYGPTEVAVDVTFWNAPKTEVTEVPIGKPAANVEVIIVDEMGLLCPPGVPGELCLAGVQVGRGYLNQPEKTKAAFIVNPYPFSEAGHRAYRTGDLTYFNHEGEIIYLGRMDDQIKVRGQRIELGEIQEGINNLPGVQQATVLPIKDENGQISLVAFVKQDKVPSDEHMKVMLAEAITDKEMRSTFTVENDTHLASERSTVTIPILDKKEPNSELFKRKSYRTFAGNSFNASILTTWLTSKLHTKAKTVFSLQRLLQSIAAFKDKDSVIAKYPYPSAGSLYPVKCYLAIGQNDQGSPPGYYYFDQVSHQLELCSKQPAAIDPGIRLTLVAHKRMMEPLYGAFWRDFAFIEAGAIHALLESHGQEMTKEPLSEWTQELNFVKAEDAVCGTWQIQLSQAQLQAVAPELLTMWLYVSDKITDMKSGLYHWDGHQLNLKAEAMFPLHLLNSGDNAKVLASSSAVAFFTAKSAVSDPAMAIGSQVITWMETGIKQFIGVCPMGTCPIPQVYADIIGESVMLAVAIGPVSEAQINAREASQASGVLQTLESYLLDQLRHTLLTEAMYPERILVVPDFPTTSNGKLDRRFLLSLAKQANASAQSSMVQPKTPLERGVFAVWQSILKDKKFGMHDSFTLAGGNSLTRNTLSLLLQEHYKILVSNAELFTCNTIAKQVELIDKRQDEELNGNASFALASMVIKGKIDMIGKLLSKVNVNQRDDRGRTALYIAAFHGRQDIVELLLWHKARVDIAKHSGTTPKGCAIRMGHAHLVDLLSLPKVTDLTTVKLLFSPTKCDDPSSDHVPSTTLSGIQ